MIRPFFPSEDDLSLYLRTAGRARMLGRTEEAHLIERAQEGDRKAQDTLVKAHLRFVVSVAMGYRNRGVPLGDLIGEGILGLIRACGKFNPSKGVKFLSYAVWWIRQAILIALAKQAGIVSLPPAWTTDRGRIRGAEQRLQQRLGRQPRIEELASETGCSEKSLLEHRAFDPFRSLLSGEPDPADGPDSLPSILPDTIPDREAADSLMHKHMETALGGLSAREKEVVRRFFGLSQEEPETLEIIARNLGLSRERIRQIKDAALVKLRSPNRIKELQLAREWMEPARATITSWSGREAYT